MILPVIMAGGSGSRLWPLSRSQYPKQFLPLVNNTSMLYDTVARLSGLNCARPLLICGEDHRFIAAEQLRESLEGMASDAFRQNREEDGGIILEPSGRNTAPAVALAAFEVLGPLAAAHALDAEIYDPVLLILAADHAIADVEAFHRAVAEALVHASQGKLVTFGVIPQSPETGYGYIRADRASQIGTDKAMTVAEFVEKPDLDTAEHYLASGNYYWNSGMFMFRASRYLEELKNFRPDIHEACREAMAGAKSDYDFIRPAKDIFAQCPEDSIDYAVMEKTNEAVVVPLDCGWSDVGSWSALWDVAAKNEDDNVLKGDVLVHDTRSCYLQSDKKLIAAVGLENVVVVESDDAIVVAAKDRVQDVKKIVEDLNAQDRSEAKLHRKVYRPWGFYDSVDCGERFQVKRIVVNPGAQLSLQMHHHRAEHWIVVSGTAQVTCGDKVFLVSENQSTFIPLGEKHRLGNPGAIALEMVEVQSGSYLGEDDIVRFEDKYSRA